jgi:ribose transport system substrate-binding protein
LGSRCLAAGGGAWAEEAAATLGAGADIKTMCGAKPTIVGVVDGFGGSTWRKTVLAELKDEASKCHNITNVLYVDGDGDLAKINSDTNSLAAQGINILILHTYFGEARYPAMREALKAGIVVVPYNGKATGKDGSDYSFNVYHDLSREAERAVNWLSKNMKEGSVLYFSGPAGNSFSAGYFADIKKQMEKYPGLKMLEDNFIATNWNATDAQKAAVGVIAKYGKVDAVITDYGPVALAIIRSFNQAGLKVPYVAASASNNELNCLYLKDKADPKSAWPYLASEGSTTTIRFAFRKALAAYQGTNDPEPNKVDGFVFADSLANIDPPCDPSMPPDADLSGLLTNEQLKAALQ